MEESSLLINERKSKIQKFLFSWVKDNYDKYFLLILSIAFILRFWIFLKTMNQPLWWDEADYMSAAKRLGLGLDIRDIWYYRRGFLFPLIAAPFFTPGIGEIGIRFLEALFSTGFILVSYLFLTRLVSKKIVAPPAKIQTYSTLNILLTAP